MKKLAFSILLSLFVSAGYAEQISESQAVQIARKYLQGQTTSIKALKTANTTVNNAEYYIFNNGNDNGFVIISGDDEMTELVGYSDSGSFVINENTPSNIINWLDQYSEYVKAIREDKATPLKQTLKALGTPIVDSFVQTRWNQDDPYNMYCPFDSQAGVRCPTGCVATAMAQIMYFWKWPEVGKGSYSYVSDYGELSADFSKSVYDWDNMRTEYYIYRYPDGSLKGDWTDTQAHAVAKLMSDCGISINMGYTPNSSGTNDQYVNYAAANFFQYDSKVYLRDAMSDKEFRAILKENLDKTIPLMFSGGSEGGGHEFVIDGYDSNDFLHVNWGWGGASDGWFDMDYMNPADLGTGGGTGGGFSNDQHMVILLPNKTNDAKYDQSYLYILDDPNGQYKGYVKALQSSVQKGENLNIAVQGYWNGGGPLFKGMIGVGIYDMEGNLIAPIKQGKYAELGAGSFIGSEILFPLNSELVDLPDGKYRIYAMSQELRDNYNFEMRRVNSQKHQDIEIKGNTITTGQADYNILELPEGFSVTSRDGGVTDIAFGKELLVIFKLHNTSNNPAVGKVGVNIADFETYWPFAGLDLDCNIAANGTQELGFIIPVSEGMFGAGKTYKIFIDPNFKTANEFSFKVMESPQNVCMFTIGGTSGVEENVADNAIKVYPNPATDKVVVETEADVVSVSLYAIDGRLVLKVDNQKELNVSDCPAGHYIISVQTQQGVINQQIIKK